ncbi:MAG: alpha/beta hydrolase [bacterium]
MTLGAIAILGAGWFLARPMQAHVGAAPLDLAAETVSIAGGSNGIIRGWFSPGKRGVGAVLLMHGNGDNRTSMLGRARFLHREGYAVLLIDLQGHGESPGRHLTFGALESVDARAALDFLRAHAPTERIGVIGYSLGGAAALLGATPLPVDAMVLEAVYPTIEDATANRLRVYLGPLGPLLLPVLTAQIHLWTGISASALRPIDGISRVVVPMLLIAGERDTRTTLTDSQRMFAAAHAPKELWIVPDAGHDDFHGTHGAAYEKRVGGFLRLHLHSTDAGGSQSRVSEGPPAALTSSR